MKKLNQVVALMTVGCILFCFCMQTYDQTTKYVKQEPLSTETCIVPIKNLSVLDNNVETISVSVLDIPKVGSSYVTDDENDSEIIEEIVNSTEECIEENIISTEVLEEETQIYYSYTEEELETFAHLLYAEAGAESDKCIYYVGSVVLNRVESDRYPNTLLEVIYQKGQYSPTWHGFMNKTPTETCYKIAQELLETGSILPADVLGQAGKSIYEKYGKELYEIVDGEYFFYM